MTEEDKIWQKKYWTTAAHEPDKSFEIFQMSIAHPTWTYKEISKKTGVPLNTIYQWAQRYKYNDRKRAKLEYETKIIDKIQLESKIQIIKKNAERTLRDEEILDAYEKFNRKIIDKLKTFDKVTPAVLKKQQNINKHLNDYLDLRSKHLRNALDTEELLKTIEKQIEDEDDEAVKGLAKALIQSHKKIREQTEK